jgi:hypothetical protein
MADIQTTFAEVAWEVVLRALEAEGVEGGVENLADVEQESLRLAGIVARTYKEIISELNRKE